MGDTLLTRDHHATIAIPANRKLYILNLLDHQLSNLIDAPDIYFLQVHVDDKNRLG